MTLSTTETLSGDRFTSDIYAGDATPISNKRLAVMKTSTLFLTGLLALAANGVHAASLPDACVLIPKAAAGKILGSKVSVKPVNTYGAPVSHCMYSTAHGGGFSLLIGRVQYKNAAAELARQKKTATASWPPSMGKPVFTDVKGLGAAATLLKGQGFFQLHVLAHGFSMVINLNHQATATNTAKARQLADIALQHLH